MMDLQNKEEKEAEQRMRRLLAQMYITHSPYHLLYPTSSPTRHLLTHSIATAPHKRKKANEKLTAMAFLKDNKTVILGYQKTAERGDINFLDCSEPKISDFYYNKLNGGMGGIGCFQDGRFVVVADKKGVFAYVDLAKGPNIDDIKNASLQTSFDGAMNLSLSPEESKLVVGMGDNRCVVLDIGKGMGMPTLNKEFKRHMYGVNSVDWHPFKSLILSSSLDMQDTIKLWDPHSDTLTQQINLHTKSSVTCSRFHPQGNTFFSMGKDLQVYQHQIRYRGYLHRYRLEHEPTALEILPNGNVVIGDNGGGLSWYGGDGGLIKRLEGSSGVVAMATDLSGSVLAVGRERQHTFEFYTHDRGLDIELDQ